MSDVKAIPDGYPQVTPYLCIDGAAEAIEFYGKVFGATQRGDRMPAPGGKVGHAELQLGDSVIMLSDEFPDMNMRSPKAVGGTPIVMSVYVEDVDAVSSGPCRLARRPCGPSRTSSTATGQASSRTRSAIGGVSPATSRTSPPTRCPNE